MGVLWKRKKEETLPALLCSALLRFGLVGLVGLVPPSAVQYSNDVVYVVVTPSPGATVL